MVVEQCIEVRQQFLRGGSATGSRARHAHTGSISARSSAMCRNLPTALSQGYSRLRCAAAWMSHFIHSVWGNAGRPVMSS